LNIINVYLSADVAGYMKRMNKFRNLCTVL